LVLSQQGRVTGTPSMSRVSPGAVQVSLASVQEPRSTEQALSAQVSVNHFETELSGTIPATLELQA
jgi:hypothetical protein